MVAHKKPCKGNANFDMKNCFFQIYFQNLKHHRFS